MNRERWQVAATLTFIAVLLGLFLLLAACTAQQADTVRQTAVVLCFADGVTQPVAVVLAGLSPGPAAIAKADNLLVHPEVMAACAATNGTPVAVTTGAERAPTPLPAVPAPG